MIFNAQLQKETEQELIVDENNEILATCKETGRQLKFPNVSEVEFEELVARHKATNEGQVLKKPLFNGQLKPKEETPA